jgi:hypothetical protein
VLEVVALGVGLEHINAMDPCPQEGSDRQSPSNIRALGAHARTGITKLEGAAVAGLRDEACTTRAA